jgi:hypothetical protein
VHSIMLLLPKNKRERESEKSRKKGNIYKKLLMEGEVELF